MRRKGRQHNQCARPVCEGKLGSVHGRRPKYPGRGAWTRAPLAKNKWGGGAPRGAISLQPGCALAAFSLINTMVSTGFYRFQSKPLKNQEAQAIAVLISPQPGCTLAAFSLINTMVPTGFYGFLCEGRGPEPLLLRTNGGRPERCITFSQHKVEGQCMSPMVLRTHPRLVST